ncbi:MAG TPA: N-6 DNA methylase, partial [Reyranella sp.]|nr:N-6 DNA methylase [Reyranella sp.]
LEYAPEESVIALVTHDSFLTANGHRELRRYILDTCRIHNLHLCPTNLFLNQGADVRTCVLILEKTRDKKGKVNVSNRPASIDEFRRILQNEAFQQYPLEDLLLDDSRDSSEFVIGVPKQIAALFGERRLSEVAPCITGISTGEDKKYLRSEQSNEFSIPFYKNPASRKFYAAPDGYLCSNYDEVGRTVSNFMIRNKELIFRGGLSCSSMGVKFGATIRPKDSACGVNPNVIIEDERRWWLLSFLNSRLCLYVTRGVIIRGNMITAGYASRIPVPQLDKKTLQLLASFGVAGFETARSGNSISKIKAAIDDTIEDALDLSVDTRTLLGEFEQDSTRLA